MFHRKRFRFVVVVMMALLLTIAFASVASAHASLPLSGDIRRDQPPIPTDDHDGGGGGQTPLPGQTPTPSGGGGGGQTSTQTRVVWGVKELVYPWPPPNAIVLHPATPLQLSAAGGGLRCYFIGRDGATRIGPFIDSFSLLAQKHAGGDAVALYSGHNPLSGKPVTIDYLTAQKKLRVSTYYADRPPHDFDKPYVFTVDANHTIIHEQW